MGLLHRNRRAWPPERREIVAAGSFLLFAVGLTIVGFGLANTNLAFTLLGVLSLALPIVRWVRVRREPEGAWTFEGELEKPPDNVSERHPVSELSHHRSD